MRGNGRENSVLLNDSMGAFPLTHGQKLAFRIDEKRQYRSRLQRDLAEGGRNHVSIVG
jgi:hypothetical protein